MTEYQVVRGAGPDVVPLGVDIKLLDHEAVVPAQAKYSDAGYDLTALEGYDLGPGERQPFRTGIAVAIPAGHVGYIKPRSGLAARHGIDVLAGVVDAGYRGEVLVLLVNTDTTDTFSVAPGDRIAQLVIQPVAKVAFLQVAELEESHRGHNGFGSTGA